MTKDTNWKDYIGKKVIVNVGWNHYIEVVVKEVSPSGMYVKFEEKGFSTWRGCYNYELCEVLGSKIV